LRFERFELLQDVVERLGIFMAALGALAALAALLLLHLLNHVHELFDHAHASASYDAA
jgi:hypothetical protein